MFGRLPAGMYRHDRFGHSCNQNMLTSDGRLFALQPFAYTGGGSGHLRPAFWPFLDDPAAALVALNRQNMPMLAALSFVGVLPSCHSQKVTGIAGSLRRTLVYYQTIAATGAAVTVLKLRQRYASTDWNRTEAWYGDEMVAWS